MIIKNLLGKKFGRSRVIGQSDERRHGQVMWKCLCKCGKETLVRSACLRNGQKSCGCLRLIGGRKNKVHGHSFSENGKRKTSPEYCSWRAMKSRCLNENHQYYDYYGGRGITICEAWKSSFVVFLADMGTRPEGTSIERIDNDGNYEPGNCCWADPIEQIKNRRNYEREK